MSEEWRPVVGYEDRYSVSSEGRIRIDFGWNKGKMFKQQPIAMGNYLGVRLSRAGKATNLRVATLVCESFIGPKPGPGYEVNHKNGQHRDNRAENLEWVTKREQEDHAIANDLHKFGEQHHAHKLTEQEVREIRAAPRGARLNLDVKYGVSKSTIVAIRTRHTWKRVV